MNVWDVSSCRLVDRYQRFGETCCLNLQNKRMNLFTPAEDPLKPISQELGWAPEPVLTWLVSKPNRQISSQLFDWQKDPGLLFFLINFATLENVLNVFIVAAFILFFLFWCSPYRQKNEDEKRESHQKLLHQSLSQTHCPVNKKTIHYKYKEIHDTFLQILLLCLSQCIR